MSDGITPLTPEQVAAQEAKAGKEGYVKRNLIALDMEGNAILDGKNDETISSRLARDAEKHEVVGEIGSKVLDVFQPDHGAKAQAGDVERAEQVIALETPGLTAGAKAADGVVKSKKPGFWSRVGNSIGEAIGQAKFGQ